MIDKVSTIRTPLMGLAILWIILFHINPDIPILKILWVCGYGGVDIFLFLSAYGLYFSMKKQSKKWTSGILQFYERRAVRILPAYYLALLFFFVTGGCWDWKALAEKVCMVGYFVPALQWDFFLWYVPALLLLYILFPFIYRYLDVIKKKRFWVIGILIISVVNVLITKDVFENDYNRFSILLLIPRIPIFILGAVWADVEGAVIEKVKFGNERKIVVVLIAFMIVAYCFAVFIRLVIPEYVARLSMLMFLPFVLVVPGFIVLLSAVYSYLPKQIKTFLLFCGTYSFELYLLHQDLLLQVSDFVQNYGGMVNWAIIVTVILCFPLAKILHVVTDKMISNFNRIQNNRLAK